MENIEGRSVASINRDPLLRKLSYEQQIVDGITESLQNPEGLSKSGEQELLEHRSYAQTSIDSLSNQIKQKRLVA